MVDITVTDGMAILLMGITVAFEDIPLSMATDTDTILKESLRTDTMIGMIHQEMTHNTFIKSTVSRQLLIDQNDLN